MFQGTHIEYSGPMKFPGSSHRELQGTGQLAGQDCHYCWKHYSDAVCQPSHDQAAESKTDENAAKLANCFHDRF
ncbi:MAG: hypothetical protein CM1200mP18_02700 [Gammaproteobacteria bacterium]|nr:MAG: hypothetical protein CM1200mP18_02700 [Gammaproteobacteria bacterium]